jgi:aminoglycoside phosphotransferase (APT) family kinase protein
MPKAEVDVTLDLVRKLLDDQHPDLAGQPIETLANGWDNVIFRLGDDLLIRLPRRELAARLVLHEQRWLPVLAPRLPPEIKIPAPVRVGRPTRDYPWSWSITPFLPGQVAARTPPADPVKAARSLGSFLRKLHFPAPADAPRNRVRGVPLAERDETVMSNIDILRGVIDEAAVTAEWETARDTQDWEGPPVWLHGDLHPANMLVHDGRLSAVIDFGDITSGDPATDLSAAWMLFPDPAHREVFWATYANAGDQTKARAKGWALAFALVYQAHSADNPLMAGIGRRVLSAVLNT